MRFPRTPTMALAILVSTGLVVAMAPPARASASETFETLIGAGDIAACNGTGASETAEILKQHPGTIFTAGDNTQTYGTEYDCYSSSWGVEELKSRTRPSPGNHDYYLSNWRTGDGAGYFEYFGDAAGEPGKGYYSYDLGSQWHVVSLNSNCDAVGCGEDSDQWVWLEEDLRENGAGKCTVAYWHHLVFTSSPKHDTDEQDLSALFQLLQANDTELLMNGHNHVYERTAPLVYDQEAQDYVRDTSGKGIQVFTVGTGGYSHDSFLAEPDIDQEISLRRIRGMFGVLKLSLGDQGTYSWEFIPLTASEDTVDSGTGSCR